MKVHRLSPEEVKTRLHELPGWALREAKLHREYKFGGFAEAFGFMSTCALVAQKQDHHPEWSNVFDRVVVDLTTPMPARSARSISRWERRWKSRQRRRLARFRDVHRVKVR